MEVINADINLGVGGLNSKGVQNSQTDEVVKNSEKTASGSSTQQSGDKLEINSVLTKKGDSAVKGYAQNNLEGVNEGLVNQMKGLIQDSSSHALEAQAGSGKTFLQALYA